MSLRGRAYNKYIQNNELSQSNNSGPSTGRPGGPNVSGLTSSAMGQKRTNSISPKPENRNLGNNYGTGSNQR